MLAVAGTSVVASAAVPAFPDNIVVFPDRDFITVEGYQQHVGETATLEVTRGGTVVGSATAVIAEGDVAFEINHPGGVCWGNGTALKVTPDIKPGDKATIKFAGDEAGDTIAQDAYVTRVNYAPGATTFTVDGHVGAGVNRAQIEQRIVNPDLVDTAVTRRDVRAVPGGLVRAPKGGYSSNLEFAGDSFTATYVFDDADTARIAATGGGERVLTWQEEDADGNRQGLTIAEHGELGGPGMGGCPAGPTDQGAPRPGTAAAVRSSDERSLQVSWTAATPAPGSAEVTGYSVEAIARTASSSGDRVQIGRRTGASATRTTIDGLSPVEAYDVEVRSLAGARMSEAFSVEVAAQSTEPGGDLTPPVVAASPPPVGGVTEAKSVTLASDENADIYYTTDGSSVITGDLPSDGARLYTGAIPITARTDLRWVAFDRAGNFGTGSAVYEPPAAPDPAPAAPTGLTGTPGQESLALRWTADDASITGYGVQLYGPGGPVGALRETTVKSLTVTGLTAGTPYTFTVKAKNAGGYGAESARSAPLTPTVVTDRITIGTARWKARDFRVSGTGSAVGATVTVRAGSTTGPVLGTATVTAAATGGAYELRLRDGAAPATRPATIYVVSNRGGVAGPFTVSG